MALVDGYLALRRAAGFKLKSTEGRLRSFASFSVAKGDTHVRTATAVEWAGSARSGHERHMRLCDLAMFARHARAEDHAHEVPPPQIFLYKRHYRLPYIYSDVDIRRILDAAGRLHRCPGDSMGDTYWTLFGLLAATGLRIREALSLQLGDVNTDRLLVRQTKFRKSRLVPIHRSTAAALDAYRQRWRLTAGSTDPFFTSRSGPKLSYSAASVAFHRVVEELGLALPPEPGRLPGPRIHDLRHTFAVRALESCPEGRAAINKHTLALSTYLGHTSVKHTYWYLHVTPQLMTQIADACETWLVGGGR